MRPLTSPLHRLYLPISTFFEILKQGNLSCNGFHSRGAFLRGCYSVLFVIPAEAGIQFFLLLKNIFLMHFVLDPRLRGDDIGAAGMTAGIAILTNIYFFEIPKL